MMKQLESLISEKTKANLMLKAFSITKVPLLFATGARVQAISQEACQIYMPFFKTNRNHLGSMYFGALAIGADACVGLLAAYLIEQRKEKVSLVFKSFESEFLRRPEGPTTFICEEGEAIGALIDKCINGGERVHQAFNAHAKTNGETVARFKMELSLKLKK